MECFKAVQYNHVMTLFLGSIEKQCFVLKATNSKPHFQKHFEFKRTLPPHPIIILILYKHKISNNHMETLYDPTLILTRLQGGINGLELLSPVTIRSQTIMAMGAHALGKFRLHYCTMSRLLFRTVGKLSLMKNLAAGILTGSSQQNRIALIFKELKGSLFATDSNSMC